MRRLQVLLRKVVPFRKSSESLVFLFFLFISFCFWLLQSLNETFDVEVEIPLALKYVPEDVMITTDMPEVVYAVVHDRGTALTRFMFGKRMDTVSVDFTHYDRGRLFDRVMVPKTDVIRGIQSNLKNSSQVKTLRPDTIDFYYNRGIKARVPVCLSGIVSAAPQHYVQKTHITPDSVDVYAPSSVLDTLQAVYTKPVTIQDVVHSQVRDVQLNMSPGMKSEPASVSLSVDVDYYTEKTVEVPVVGLNFPGDKALRTFPSKAKVTFRVGAARFHEITPDMFVLLITYEELLQNTSSKYHLHLKSMPEGTSNPRIDPQEVDYLIEEVSEEAGEVD